MPDIALDANGDIYRQSRVVDGPELVRQRIENRLRTHRGEYVLDTRQGLPYREWLAAKPAPLDEIADAIRLEVETTPGVARVSNFSYDIDGREVRVSVRAVLESEDVTTFDVSVDPTQSGITRVRVAQ